MPRVLLIGLDGMDVAFAEAMMAEGRLPHLRRLRDAGARFKLDHGEAKYSGLAWEHVSEGLAPEDGARWSTVAFDPKTYAVSQPVTRADPFFAALPVKTVSFDLPYGDLMRTQNAEGVSNWGAHDPGVATDSRPKELGAELDRRFGRYPAPEWIYGFAWPSPEKTKAFGDGLVEAARVRAEAARWTLAERLPDWDLGIVVVAEPHSAAEGLWHGVDPAHPLHGIASTAAAGDALRRVYDAVDDLVGVLAAAFPDAVLMAFSMHGMGVNKSDVPAMLLLPELLYRHAFGEPYMKQPDWPAITPGGVPLLPEDETWDQAFWAAAPLPRRPRRHQRIAQRLGLQPRRPHVGKDLNWMPVARYAAFWPKMSAFALPAYYNGRIRVNLKGREAWGRVPRSRYAATCEAIAKLLAECRDVVTGEPAVAEARFQDDPAKVGIWDGDITVYFHGSPLGFVHPRLGTIGPSPYRRTGGHTGDWGFLYMAGPDVAAREHGIASSFDVVPTALDLLGQRRPPRISGVSLMPRMRQPAAGLSPA